MTLREVSEVFPFFHLETHETEQFHVARVADGKPGAVERHSGMALIPDLPLSSYATVADTP